MNLKITQILDLFRYEKKHDLFNQYGSFRGFNVQSPHLFGFNQPDREGGERVLIPHMVEWGVPTDVFFKASLCSPHLEMKSILQTAQIIEDRRKERRSQYQQERAVRPTTHCSLLVNRLAGASTKTRIICSSQPQERLKELNQKADQKYELVETVSPFNAQTGLSGSAFAHIWKKTSRDEHGRIVAGAQLAQHFCLDLYDHVGGDMVKNLLLTSKRFREGKLPQWRPKKRKIDAISKSHEEGEKEDEDYDVTNVEETGEFQTKLANALKRERQFQRAKKRLRRI